MSQKIILLMCINTMSEVWNYFTKNSNSAQVMCNKCQVHFKWNSQLGTSTLIRHLQSHAIVITPSIPKPKHIEKSSMPPEKIKSINEKYIKFVIKNNEPFILLNSLKKLILIAHY